jgi:7-cyano-7-deazaguanine synthase
VKTIVLFSGGFDSAACAHWLLVQKHLVELLFIDYGQQAAPHEISAAEALSSSLSLTLQRFQLTTGRRHGAGEIRCRNAILILSAILSEFYCEPCLLALGIHAGTPYYDCTPAFLETINRLVGEQSNGTCRVIAPFLTWTKVDIFKYFSASGLDVNLPYSCETGSAPPCGKCLSCRDRELLPLCI